MLLPQHVVNELVVNSAIVLLDNNQQQLVVEEDRIGISTFDEIIGIALSPSAVEVRKKRTRSNDTVCGVCSKPTAQHGDEQWVECSTCEAWCSFVCCGIASHMAPTIQAMPKWECPKCRGHF